MIFTLFLWIFPMFFINFSNVFPLFLWLVPITPSDGPGGNRYPPSPNCNTVHNPAKPPSRNTLPPRGERDLRATVQLCPPDPLFSLRSHKATSQPAGLPFVTYTISLFIPFYQILFIFILPLIFKLNKKIKNKYNNYENIIIIN